MQSSLDGFIEGENGDMSWKMKEKDRHLLADLFLWIFFRLQIPSQPQPAKSKAYKSIPKVCT